MSARHGYRQALAGLLAGMSGAVTIVAGLVFVLLIGIGWQLIQETASGVARDQMWPSLAQDLSRLPGFLGSFGWGLLALAGIGLPLAFVDGLGAHIDRPWSGYLS